jgi:site-specific recombinase XerD
LKTHIQRELYAYRKYLLDVLNLAKNTRIRYENLLQIFLEYFFHDKRINLTSLTPKMIRDYVDQVPSIVDERRKKNTCSMLNCYFRFSLMNGKKIGNLQVGIPSFQSSYNSPPVEIIERDEINMLLNAVDRSTPVGKRTYASILCQIDLCLRIGEVSRLKLEDIDWRNGRIRVFNNKARKPYWLPLPKRVGQAIVDYLSNGRPKSNHREIFISHFWKRNHPVKGSHLCRQVNLMWKKAGLDDRFSGTHILRHYSAALMKQNGCSIKVISDILGHSSLQTTAIYAKVDVPHLRQIAQDWPGKEVEHDED